MPDATVVIDREKKVIAWNRAMEEMAGLKKSDILGQGEYSRWSVSGLQSGLCIQSWP
ncbi:MAG: PAS domain-containing protein [Syntrophobacteraceae bacterium]